MGKILDRQFHELSKEDQDYWIWFWKCVKNNINNPIYLNLARPISEQREHITFAQLNPEE